MKRFLYIATLLLALAFVGRAQTHVTDAECQVLFNGSGGSGAGGRGNNTDFRNCITSAATSACCCRMAHSSPT